MYILEVYYNKIGSDWIMTGFVQILAMIAILQLVKKIPEIINTIFGTKIQTKNGIKGRLGEMAGVGGLAQKAWTGLGTGAKNLAKALTVGTAGGLAYGGYKMATGDAQGKKGFEGLVNRLKTGRDIRDTKAGRVTKGALSGFNSAWKTGSPLKAIDAYKEGSKAPSYTSAERIKAQKIAAQQMRKEIMDKTGYDLIDDNGNIVNVIKDKDGKNFIKDSKGASIYVPQEAINKANDTMYRYLNSGKFGAAGKEKARQMRAQELKTGIDGLTSRENGAMESLKSFINTPANANLSFKTSDGNEKSAATMAGLISNKIRDGENLSEDDYKFLRAFGDNSDIKDTLAYYKKLQNESVALKFRFSEYDGNTGSVGLGILAGRQEGIINDAKQQFEIAKEKMSIVDQDALAFAETALNNSFKTLNGAYQNNASIYSLLEKPAVDVNGKIQYDARGNIVLTDTNLHYSEKEGVFYTNDIKNPIDKTKVKDAQEYVNLIKNGIVTTSVNDYHLDTTDDDAVKFAKIVSEIEPKSGTVEYYKELHKKLREEFASNQVVINSIDRIEKSGFLPTHDPEPVSRYESFEETAGTTTVIKDQSGNPIQMPSNEKSSTTYTHIPTAEENDDRHEREWATEIERLNNKGNLTPEEKERREDLIRSLQRIDSDRMKRNGGTLDE